MKTIVKSILVAGIALWGLTACNKDKDNYKAPEAYSYAYVVNPDEKANFEFVSDKGNHFEVTQTDFPGYRPEDGQRIIPYYDIVSKTGDKEGEYDYKVHLRALMEILTKDYVILADEDEEELGNDRLGITTLWIANDYLNVDFDFYFTPGNVPHFINLAYTETDRDGKVHFELRHNAYDDPGYHLKYGLVSFKLEKLQEGLPDGTDRLNLVVHYKSLNGDDKTKEIEYVFGSVLTSDAYVLRELTEVK